MSPDIVLSVVRWIGIGSLTIAVLAGVIMGYLDARRTCKQWREDKSAL